MVKVSIVVPIYNVGNYLKKCLDSIINQSFKEIEIILINDGSTDESGAICDKYELMDNRIRVKHTTNKGSGEARNLGLDLANGEYIYFCDPDDWIEQNLIEDNYKLASKYCADIIIFGVNNYMYNSKRKSYIYTGSREVRSGELSFREEFPGLYKKGLATSVWNKLYKLSYLKQNNCRFPRYSQGQDWSFNILVYRDLENVVYNPRNYYNYVKYENNTAITKYNKDKSFIRQRLFTEFKTLLDYWSINNDSYNELLYKCLLGEILAEFRNNFHVDSPDTFSEKFTKTKQLVNTNLVNQILGNYKNKEANMTEKLLIFCVKRKIVSGIILEAYLRRFLRSYFKSFFYNIKNFITQKKTI